MKKQNIRFIATAGMIGALYVVLTLISAMFGLSSGVIQVRISEMLCVLPVYTAAAIPGVTVGCLLANLIVGGTVWDIVFGTLATLIGAVAAYFMRHTKYLAFIPTVVSNMLIIPTVLILSGLGGWEMFPYFALTVGLGEIISCGVFGDLMVLYFERHPSVVKTLFDSSPVRAVEKA
ncbi:MAG: QueT transporter family protein [Eubacteriales bacterium]|nr:QueT transporter family protein [Clostridiales bacterium]MDD7302268.1 QueT transporter family protein [Eubacteriales bacterium]MDY4435840.1 QueT transporter family protein [Candidatus Flemingibacterium sp.]